MATGTVAPLPASTRIGPEDQFVTVNGLRLHYLDWGWTSAEALVCLPGLGGHGHIWDSFAGAIRTVYRVYALDQRGQGDSEWPAAPDYLTAHWVSDLKGLLDALGVDRAVLVGHSMGAHNAMAFAARYPDRVKQLVLVDMGPARNPPANRVPPPADFADLDEAVAYAQQTSPQTPLEQQVLRLTWATKVLPNGRLGFKADPRVSDAWQADNLWDELPRITAPTLILRAALSQTLPEEVGQKMAQTIPQARFEVVEGAGHSIHADRPAAFAALVLQFLRGAGTGEVSASGR
ncbi:MAG: alpha/beta hydrolase [Chloroflexi bacterium]|nr:alpha/beta hydrolase [Chloroflexota bacterium]